MAKFCTTFLKEGNSSETSWLVPGIVWYIYRQRLITTLFRGVFAVRFCVVMITIPLDESGKNFDHRREWMVERIKLLSSVYSIDNAAYAIMSNQQNDRIILQQL